MSASAAISCEVPVRITCSPGPVTLVRSLGKPSTTVRVTCTPRSGQISGAIVGDFLHLTFNGETYRVPADQVS